MGKKSKKNKKTRSEAPAPRVEKATPAKSRSTLVRPLAIIAVVVVLAASLFYLFFFRSNAGLARAGCCADYNVLLITLDTLRADRLPVYGFKDVETPAIDRLAGESFVFTNAYSHAPLTLPAHTSILTGVLPIAHGIRDNAGFVVSDKDTTLTEILKSKGYATGAFVSAFVLDGRWNLNQGFDVYQDAFNVGELEGVNISPREIQRRAEETRTEFEHWLGNNKDKKFFSWVHFYDPHDPYDPPEPYRSKYAHNPYLGEIAYTDENVGRLLEKLEEFGLQERTIILVVGDHGEGLGEHNEMTHGMFVYNSTQHIPFLLHIPGGRKQEVDSIASQIDIAPTLLELLGLTVPAEMQGQSLVPVMNGKEKKERLVYSESMYAELHYGWSRLVSITSDQYRYIDAPKPELYDKVSDPGETKNLIQEKPEFAKVLKSRLQDMIAKFEKKNLSGPQKMDPETEEKLRALGYIGGSVQPTAESLKIDPKDKIHLARAIQEGFGLIRKESYQEALHKINPVLEEDPQMTDGHLVAAAAYIGLEKYPEAIDELMKTLALRSDYTMALFNLGYAYELMGNLNEAEVWYQKVLQYEKNHQQATMKLAHLYRQKEQPEKAAPYFDKALKAYLESLEATKGETAKGNIHATVGEIYFASGNHEEALKHYSAAIKLTPDTPSLHYNLAQIYEARGDLNAAVAEYQRETEVDPSNFKAFNNLGIIFKQANLFDQALVCFRKVVDLQPDDPRGYFLLASTYQKMGKDEEAREVLRLAQGRAQKKSEQQ